MSLRRSIIAAAVVYVIGINPVHGAAPAKAASPAPAPRATGANNPAAAANVKNEQRVARNGEKTANGAKQGGGQTVYVPGYGYTNWTGNYSNPYWSTPGTWYASDDGYQSTETTSTGTPTGSAAAAARSARVQQEESAHADMMAARARLSRQFEAGEDVHTALHEVQDAQREYDAAVAAVNRRLKLDPAYEEAAARKEHAAEKVEAARAADHPPIAVTATTQPAPISPEVVHAAQQKLDAASQVTAIAADHEQVDPAVKAARDKLEAAAERLNGMKERFDTALQADPQWQAAKQKLAAARATDAR